MLKNVFPEAENGGVRCAHVCAWCILTLILKAYSHCMGTGAEQIGEAGLVDPDILYSNAHSGTRHSNEKESIVSYCIRLTFTSPILYRFCLSAHINRTKQHDARS